MFSISCSSMCHVNAFISKQREIGMQLLIDLRPLQEILIWCKPFDHISTLHFGALHKVTSKPLINHPFTLGHNRRQKCCSSISSVFVFTIKSNDAFGEPTGTWDNHFCLQVSTEWNWIMLYAYYLKLVALPLNEQIAMLQQLFAAWGLHGSC